MMQYPIFRSLSVLLASSCLLGGCALGGAARFSPGEMCLREIRTELNDLRHAVSNIAFETEMLNGKCDSQAEQIALLHDHLDEGDGADRGAHQDIVNLRQQIKDLDEDYTSLVNGLRQVKSSVSDQTASLSHQRKRMNEVESSVDLMHQALSGMTELIQPETIDATILYTVEAGDTLEKIARRKSTSVGRLREANGLTSDMIRVGQKLNIR